MHVKNIIRTYPCTIFFLILFLFCIFTISIESKVYATSTSKSKKCNCVSVDCPQELPPQVKNCSLRANGCYCTLGTDISWTYCPEPSVEVCTLIEGCSSCDGNCTSIDCNNECGTEGCTGCFTQVVDNVIQCTKPSIDCGDCHIIDP